MNYQGYSFVRDSFDSSTNERDLKIYAGKLMGFEPFLNTYSFVFKVEDSILRMELTYLSKEEVKVSQKFSESTSDIDFKLNGDGKYVMTLKNGYSLEFKTRTTFIKVDDFETILKYNLIEPASGDVISVNEIRITKD